MTEPRKPEIREIHKVANTELRQTGPNTGGSAPRIMIVEDERIVALDLKVALIHLGYDIVASVSSGEIAVEQAAKLQPNLILMDIRLAGTMDGVEAAAAIRKASNIPVIYLTAHSDDSTLGRATRTGPFGYVVKPFKSAELHCAIEVALHRHEIEASLKEREQWLSITLKSIGDGIIAVDSENKVRFLNRVAEILSGYGAAEALGRIFDDIIVRVNKSNTLAVPKPPEQASAERTAKEPAENTVLIKKGGKTISIENSSTPILTDSGERMGEVMVFRDVTEERQAKQDAENDRRNAERDIQKLNAELEARVAERTAQLETANQELESFSYSVAHDLRAPLRGIEGFSVALIEDHTGSLGPEGVACLTRIREGIRRMRELIDGLLRLASISRSDCDRRTVDLTAMATEILAELKVLPENLRIQEGVTVEGDSQLLRIAMMNLLDNARKFSGKVDAPRIEFGALAGSEGNRVCFVRDNGAGFQMKYAGKLFGAFQRCHLQEEFEGTGIGLAIVERIIHRHGGRIWAESVPDQGASFYFVV